MKPPFGKYLEKHPPFTSFNVGDIKKAGILVVIPTYLEDGLCRTLDSICACHPVQGRVAVIVVVNAGVNATEDIIKQQKKTIQELKDYKVNRDFIDIYIIEAFNLPKKHFGAGLARKIGMDIAVQHLSDSDNENGVIVSLDADSTVDANYLTEIDSYFAKPQNKACSISFEHPVAGNEFDPTVYDAIAQYELHLRYYVESLRYIGFPYAFHTIGSCFAFKASSYVSVGGMNRRQGGEEFYFIQKLLQQGGYGELNTTKVYPSPRISSRVPFGTGPSVKKMVENKDEEYRTYNLQGFIDLKSFLDNVEKYYRISEETYQQLVLELPGRVRSFLLNSDFYNELKPVADNCSTLEVFRKRFFQVFNAFKLVKYINYTHEHFLEKTPVFDAAIELLELKHIEVDDIFDDRELLKKYREIQK
ncbi:glycosyltransferase [Saccharicrinis sp. GN24d3]|uniref:glycosyltransferase n=1 Tax=Saccharicrinis sp. GN24d3 TaxID=3458416 RepID=UPI00403500F3